MYSSSNDSTVVRPLKPPNAPSPKVVHVPKPPTSTTAAMQFPVKNEDPKKSKTLFSAQSQNVGGYTDPELKLNGFVGFDSLPYQYVRRCQNNGLIINNCLL
jgi:hypothetical protein